VPEIELGICSCERGLETLRHVLVHCLKKSEHRRELRRVGGGSLEFKKLLDTPERAGVTSRWIVHSRRLHQFSLARVLLYK
jgi:hypothetical protein